MRHQVKSLIVGTPLEPIARKIYSLFPSDKKGYLYNIQTFEVMKRVLNEDSNCIDIGCHEGVILKDIIHFAPKGNHFAFEPIPNMYKRLVESFKESTHLHFYDFALSDTEGETSFQHVVSNPAYSGLRNRKYPHPDQQIHEIAVKTNLLDNIIPENVPIHFIKIDVEGAEFLVFKGAIKTIIKNKPVIIFEHGMGAADYYGTDPDVIYELLVLKCGLHLFLMAEWLEDNQKVPLTRQAFSKQFYEAKNYYFMAHP